MYRGTKGYDHVPAPWWKTNYLNYVMKMQRIIGDIFCQLDGRIRYELVAFVQAIDNGRMARYSEEYRSNDFFDCK